jgi:hypothetical protein
VRDDIPIDEVKIQASHAWPAASATSAVGADGHFVIPVSSGAVVAFHDANENGVADLFAEATAHCSSGSSGWKCALGRTRIVAHRTTTGVVEDGAMTDTDSLTLRAEHYLHDGTTDSAALACLRDRPDVCARPGADALGPRNSAASAISPCELDDEVAPDRPFVVDLDAADGRRSLEVPYPARLDASVSVLRSGDRISIRATAAMPITYAIVWYGDVDANTVHWSSEQEIGTLRVRGEEVEATVPVAALNDCDACKLMLQIAHVEEHEEVAAYSEARFAIARGPS